MRHQKLSSTSFQLLLHGNQNVTSCGAISGSGWVSFSCSINKGAGIFFRFIAQNEDATKLPITKYSFVEARRTIVNRMLLRHSRDNIARGSLPVPVRNSNLTWSKQAIRHCLSISSVFTQRSRSMFRLIFLPLLLAELKKCWYSF